MSITSGDSATSVPWSAKRNSSIELLRIVSMVMIIGFHFLLVNSEAGSMRMLPVGISKFFYENLFLSGGWIGNCIFFTISVWFLVERNQTLKKCLRRVWILEREVLFWSIVIFVFVVSMHLVDGNGVWRLLFVSLFPLSSSLWWYPTSYAIFLVLLPFLQEGLQSLGKSKHRNLVIIVLTMWGIGGLIYGFNFDLTVSSVFVMMYWFILITYYKWYMHEFSSRQCMLFILSGLCIEIIYWIGTNWLSLIGGRDDGIQNFIYDHWKLPSMMIGFSLFVLARKRVFYSKVVNRIAKTTFGVFLIHYHPNVYSWWTSKLPLSQIVQHSRGIGVVIIVGIIVSVFCVCSLLDLCRQVIFHYTIDRNPGRLFDWVWNKRSLVRHKSVQIIGIIMFTLLIAVSFMTGMIGIADSI